MISIRRTVAAGLRFIVMSELEIIDGTNHIEEVKRLVIEYTEFLGRDLSFQHVDDELSDLSAKYLPPEGRLLCAG